MERAAAAGLVARGVLHAIIGASALMITFGNGGAFLDTEQAADQVQRQPYGDAMMVALGIGLGCYGLWRIAQGAFGHGKPGDDRKKAVAKRIGRAVSGAVHVAFAVSAFQSAAGSDQGGRSSWVHRVLAWDGGRWLVVAVGVGFVVAGVHQIYRAWTAKFREELDTSRLSRAERTWAIRVGRLGLAARGVVMPIIGWMLIRAGLDANAAEARGSGAALREIAIGPWGEVLLPVVAVGLIAYAVYMFVEAWCHRDVMQA